MVRKDWLVAAREAREREEREAVARDGMRAHDWVKPGMSDATAAAIRAHAAGFRSRVAKFNAGAERKSLRAIYANTKANRKHYGASADRFRYTFHPEADYVGVGAAMAELQTLGVSGAALVVRAPAKVAA